MDKRNLVSREYAEQLLKFYIDIVKTQSYSDEEGSVAREIIDVMNGLGYDECFIDRAGNACGRMGVGRTVVSILTRTWTQFARMRQKAGSTVRSPASWKTGISTGAERST